MRLDNNEAFGRCNKDYRLGRLHPTLTYLVKNYGYVVVSFQDKYLQIRPERDLTFAEILDIHKMFPIKKIMGGGSWGGSWFWIECDISELKYVKLGKSITVDPIIKKYEAMPNLDITNGSES